MSDQNPSAITGEYKLLLRVPKKEIIDDLLLSCKEEELIEALAPIASLAPPINQAQLSTLSLQGLILLVQGCKSISIERIRALHDQYRYTGMKTLYLYEIDTSDSIEVIPEKIEQLAQLVDDIRKKLSVNIANFESPVFSDLEVMATASAQIVEFSYSYIANISITKPETELPDTVKDLRRGFVWLSTDHLWLAICAHDAHVDALIASALEHQFRFKARRLPLPKPVLQQLYPLEQIRRLSLLDQATNTKRRWTNPVMKKDTKAMGEIQARDAEDERTACGYNEILPDGEEFALGFSTSQSRIFFSRDLTVSQLREWGPEKITELVEAVRGHRGSNSIDFISAVAEQIFGQISTRYEARPAIIDLARAILGCKDNGMTQANLSYDTLALYSKISKFVYPHFIVDCHECNDEVDIECADCHTRDFRIKDQSLVCQKCGKVADLSNVHCSEGHISTVLSATDLLYLTPQSNLLELLQSLIECASDKKFNVRKEFFRIRGNTLYYTHPGEKILYSIDEIQELQALLQDDATPDQLKAIVDNLYQFDEKCSKYDTDRCATCVADRYGGPCYLRLFGLFDPDFIPKPHSGFEYGDYHRTITVESGRRQMVVAMKSGPASNKSITMREEMGRDIFSQVRQYFADSTIQAVGISVPRRLEERFVEHLKMDAERFGKNLILIDQDDLARIVHSVIAKRGLTFEQI